MTLPAAGNPLSLSQIEGEFGGSGAKSLSEYYAAHSSVPTSGNPISISDFYGLSDNVSFSFTIQGAGGAGGYGLSDQRRHLGGQGASGGATSISGSGMTTVSVAGGTGGLNSYDAWNNAANRNGQASFYGAGGAGGGSNSNTPGSAPASSSYGAGGGGGGSDAPNTTWYGWTYDYAGNGGRGGNAGTRNSGSATVPSGTTITITVGSGGVGTGHPSGYSQGRDGGNGAGGVAFITYNGTTTTYGAGTHTQTLN